MCIPAMNCHQLLSDILAFLPEERELAIIDLAWKEADDQKKLQPINEKTVVGQSANPVGESMKRTNKEDDTSPVQVSEKDDELRINDPIMARFWENMLLRLQSDVSTIGRPEGKEYACLLALIGKLAKSEMDILKRYFNGIEGCFFEQACNSLLNHTYRFDADLFNMLTIYSGVNAELRDNPEKYDDIKAVSDAIYRRQRHLKSTEKIPQKKYVEPYFGSNQQLSYYMGGSRLELKKIEQICRGAPLPREKRKAESDEQAQPDAVTRRKKQVPSELYILINRYIDIKHRTDDRFNTLYLQEEIPCSSYGKYRAEWNRAAAEGFETIPTQRLHKYELFRIAELLGLSYQQSVHLLWLAGYWFNPMDKYDIMIAELLSKNKPLE